MGFLGDVVGFVGKAAKGVINKIKQNKENRQIIEKINNGTYGGGGVATPPYQQSGGFLSGIFGNPQSSGPLDLNDYVRLPTVNTGLETKNYLIIGAIALGVILLTRK